MSNRVNVNVCIDCTATLESSKGLEYLCLLSLAKCSSICMLSKSNLQKEEYKKTIMQLKKNEFTLFEALPTCKKLQKTISLLNIPLDTVLYDNRPPIIKNHEGRVYNIVCRIESKLLDM